MLGLAASSALAGNSGDKGLKPDRQAILPTACNGSGTTLVVNVSYELTNDADSGFAGNEWANDTIQRTLQIWQQPDGSYCAVAGDSGSFVTLPGTSPSANSTLSGGIDGTIQGGYVATFTGSPKTSPDYATSGDLGTFDLQCAATSTAPARTRATTGGTGTWYPRMPGLGSLVSGTRPACFRPRSRPRASLPGAGPRLGAQAKTAFVSDVVRLRRVSGSKK